MASGRTSMASHPTLLREVFSSDETFNSELINPETFLCTKFHDDVILCMKQYVALERHADWLKD